MSTDQINRLHEQASERYLNGDYQGAIDAWRDVLGLDAENEQAREGVHLASQFVEPSSEPSSGPSAHVLVEGSPEIDQDLEEGLKVLDGLRTTTMLDADIANGEVDRKPGPPQSDSKLAVEETLEGWESKPVSAAASELRRRVDDLLAEAKTKAETGEREDALAILSRLAILDEDNAEAAALRSKIEAEGASDLDKIELAIIEGVAALEADDLDEAERRLNEAMMLAPDHREARHYLDKVAERRAKGGEELLGFAQGEAAPNEGAVELATGAAAEPPPPALALKPIRPVATAQSEPPEPPPAQAGRRFALPPPKFLIFGAIGAAALISAAIVLPRLLGGGAAKTSAPSAAKLSPAKIPVPSASAPLPNAGAEAAVPSAPVDPKETARRIASSLATGRSLMASQDFGGAVVAFNETLTLDPGNAAAKAGIADAGDRYKASKAERDALNSIKMAFRDEEFSSGLRLAYRLPPSVSASYAQGVKVVGWYNLAVVALRAGDCREALSHLDEALQVVPGDAETNQLRDFASRYVEAVKDRAFLDRVEALAFRSLPAS